MDNKFPKHHLCLISGSADLKELKGYERHYLVKSKPTGFVFCSRIPAKQELTDYYNKYPRQGDCPSAIRRRYRELLEEFEPYRNSNKILDVGCGDGFFLEEAKKLGWEAHGTEYSDEATEICKSKNIEVKCGALNDLSYPENFFDVVTSFEVIEHINNPVETVSAMRKVVRKGGLVYVTTPNFNALSRYILKDRYNIIEYPEHLCYYTPRTLTYLFENNGFRERKIRTTGFSISRLRRSLLADRSKNIPALETNRNSNADSALLSKSQTNIIVGSLMSVTNYFLNMLGIGSSLKGWYIKN